MTSGGEKQTQVLNDLASFYVSNSNFDFTPPGSPAKVTPPTSDSEQDLQLAAEVQRNVFIKSHDVASRRRKGYHSNNRKQQFSAIGGALAPVEEVSSGRRRRARPASRTTDSLSVSSIHSSTAAQQRIKCDDDLGAKTIHGNEAREGDLVTEVPLKDGDNGSALDRLKRRSTSSERRRPAPGRNKSDELAETDSSRRSNSRDSGRRPRRRKTEGEDSNMVGDAGQVKDPDAMDGDGEEVHSDKVGTERVVDLKDPDDSSSSGRRRAPGRSKSDDLDRSRSSNSRDGRRRARRRNTHGDSVMTEDVNQIEDPDKQNEDTGKMVDNALEADHENSLKESAESSSGYRRPSSGRNRGRNESDKNRGSSGERSRRRQRHRGSEGSAIDASEEKFEGSGHRKSIRSSGQSDLEQNDGGSRRKMSSRPDLSETSLNANEVADSENDLTSTLARKDSSSKNVATSLNKLKQAAQPSALEKLKEATKDGPLSKKLPEISSTSAEIRTSKWSGVKHGMAFIHKAKAQAEEDRRNGRHSRRDHRRARDSSSGYGQTLSAGNRYAESRTTGSSSNNEPGKIQSRRGSSEEDFESKNSTHAETKISGKTNGSGEIEAVASGRPSRPQGNAKWSAIKERSVSRSKSTDRIRTPTDEDCDNRSPVNPLKRRNSEMDAFSNNLALVDDDAIPKPSSQPQLTSSNSSSSISASKQAAEIDETTPGPIEEASDSEKAPAKPASAIFKSLLGKNRLKKKASNTPPNGDNTQSCDTSATDIDIDETSEEKTTAESASKPSGLKKLLRNSLVVSETGKAEKNGSRWGGIRSGIDFTSRLMKVTSDKRKQDNEAVSNEETTSDAVLRRESNGCETDKPKKGALWNMSLGAGANKGESTDDGVLNYGLIMSATSFSKDATDDLANFYWQEAIFGGDKNSSSEEPDEDDLELETLDVPESDDGDNLCQDAEVAGPATSADGPDLFSIMETASSQTQAVSLLSSSTQASSLDPTDRRSMLKGLAAPSMRFEFDKKTEVVTNRTRPDIIEEADEEDEESEDQAIPIDNDGLSSYQNSGYASAAHSVGDAVHIDEYSSHNDNSDSEDEDATLLSPMKFMQLKVEPTKAPSYDLAVAIHSLDHAVDGDDDEDEIAKIHHMNDEASAYLPAAPEQRIQASPGEVPEVDKEEVRIAEDATSSGIGLRDLDVEYEGLREEIEASKARSKISRDAVHHLKQDIHKYRQLYEHAERRRQEANKKMQKQNIRLEKIGGS